MKNKLILITLAILLLIGIPIVSATIDEIRFIGEKGTVIDIKEPCFINGTYCSATADVGSTGLGNYYSATLNLIRIGD